MLFASFFSSRRDLKSRRNVSSPVIRNTYTFSLFSFGRVVDNHECNRRNNAGCGAKCCPYGHTFAAPCILGVLAMVSTYSATFSCHLLDTNAVFNGKKVDFFVGPWTVEDFKISSTGDVDYEDCVGWDEHDLVSTSLLDAPARFSRSISMIGCFAAFIFWVVLMFSSCCVFDSFVFNSMIPVFGLAAITSILTLVRHAHDETSDQRRYTHSHEL